MNVRLIFGLAGIVCGPAFAAALVVAHAAAPSQNEVTALEQRPPAPQDYARGILVVSDAGLPLIETTLPDVVYRSVTRSDLRDLRVFNAHDAPVPHALCAALERPAPIVAEHSLPVFELREARRVRDEAGRLEIHTPGGTRVRVQDERRVPGTASDAPPAPGSETTVSGRTHIIDVHQIAQSLRAIQFDWASPDEASSVQVSIEASVDLDDWAVLVPATTLLRARRGEQELKRERIELPQQPYEYLRVRRLGAGPPLVIKAVIAESVVEAPELEPLWFTPQATGKDERGAALFDTGRLAPVRYVRLRLPQENSSVRVTLQSRANARSTWVDRWGGEVYRYSSGMQRRESAPGRFDATTDRYWRVRLQDGATLPQPLSLELGYRPARLRFFAQGSGPFTIAFGSRRAALAPATACDALLSDVDASDRAKLVGEAATAQLRTLGGETALRPLPEPTPLRVVVLWSVLVLGAALLVAMAWSLLKRLRPG